ncbi:MAG: hypothetical protein ACT4TC_19295 [Myxococcaceae bacterium]
MSVKSGTSSRLAGFLALVSACAALAQSSADPIPQRLYLDSGALVGSSRLIGLGGAYVGIAEGADGLASNFASLAQKSPTRTDGWDFDATFSLLFGAAFGSRDLDNDGQRDSARSGQELMAGLSLQIGRVGLGVYFRSSAASFCLAAPCDDATVVEVHRIQSGLAAAVAVWKDQLLFGLGFLTTSAQFTTGPDQRFYTGGTLEADALFRPLGQRYRIGLSVKPSTVGTPQGGAGNALLAGRGLYSGTVSPTLVSLGGSVRLGSGHERYNRLAPDARGGLLPEEEGPPVATDGEDPPGRWLLSAQLDLILPVNNATGLATFVQPLPDRQVVATRFALLPRIGAEHETALRRLRNRLGFYLEPSAFLGGRPRPHVTGGAQLYVLELIWRWSVSASFDLARDYYNFGLSLGFWN